MIFSHCFVTDNKIGPTLLSRRNNQPPAATSNTCAADQTNGFIPSPTILLTGNHPIFKADLSGGTHHWNKMRCRALASQIRESLMDELAAALDPAGSGFVASRTRAVKIQGDGDRFWSAGPVGAHPSCVWELWNGAPGRRGGLTLLRISERGCSFQLTGERSLPVRRSLPSKHCATLDLSRRLRMNGSQLTVSLPDLYTRLGTASAPVDRRS